MSSISASFLDHFPVQKATKLKSGQYQVLRKLGEGTTSATWLVLDSTGGPDYQYYAAKILTLEATADLTGPASEVDFLKKIFALEDPNHLALLHDRFFEQGRKGRHLCIVMVVNSTSVAQLRRTSATKSLPVYMVRNIMYMTLEALAQLHDLSIVHTDVKPDNLLLSNEYSHPDLSEYLDKHPVETDGEYKIDGETFPIFKLQPIPNRYTCRTSAFEAELMTIYLHDFGHAQHAHLPPTASNFSAVSLRAPEVILRTSFGTPMDIWAIGCLTFELTVGRWLFHPEDGEGQWTLEDDHLAKIMELTGQRFSNDVLRSEYRKEFFDPDGNLLRIPELIPVTLEDAMRNYKIPGLTDEDISRTAEFVRDCLKVDPKDRPTAEELLTHPYFKRVFGCH